MKSSFERIKKLRCIIGMLVVMFVCLFNFSCIVNAAESDQEIKRLTNVYITANVPEGYDKDVIVYFKNEENEESILLRESEGYTKKRMMLEGTYQTWAERKNSTDFSCEIQETCVVSGTEMDFTFTVLSTHQEVSESEAQAILENNAEPISAEVMGIEDGKEVFQEFLIATEYIQENPYFLKYHADLNESNVYKKRFLQAPGDVNTEDEWNNMSSYDVMVYFDTFYNPYNTIMYEEISDEENFVTESERIEEFRNAEDGERYADALEKVIRWQWQYYEQTGTLYNFYAEEGNENAHFNQIEQTDENGLTKEESKELEEAREELLEGEDIEEVLGEEKDELPIVKFLKENVISVIVLIAALVGMVAMTFYIKNKKSGAE